ncbi:MAG: chemotaxis protein [Alphaproteobacteria bacterium]
MKLLFRNYLSSLKERDELDAILPDLLSELGFTVYSRPQRGTSQAGVDIAAVGKDEDGEQKVFLFSIKQGDLTRYSWDNDSPQAMRPSLNEILDNYIPHRIPKRYKKLKIVICLVFGGDMHEQLRSTVNGYIEKNSTDRISFDEWNGDKLAGLLLQGILREEIMPKELRSHLQKAVAMVDEPDVAYQHFSYLVRQLCQKAKNGPARIRVARQIYIALWVLFVWARDIDNLEAPYQASELTLLYVWELLRPHIGAKSLAINKALTSVLNHTIALHLIIATDFLNRKILPHAAVPDAISMAVHSRTPIDVNIKLFDILGRIALTGLWQLWQVRRETEDVQTKVRLQLSELSALGFKLISNNSALFLPARDQQAIEIALFLLFVARVGGNADDAHAWLLEITRRLRLSVISHGQYPNIFSNYHELIAHPRAQTDEYRREATAGSILIPLLAAFLSAFGNKEALQILTDLKAEDLAHCTLQWWIPDRTSEDSLYIGRRNHGVAICDLPLSSAGNDLIDTLQTACKKLKAEFASLSAINTECWLVVLTACRHYRLPIPPQFWLEIIA